MKKILPILAIALLVGCATQQKLLYNTLATVETVTTGAYNSYIDLVVTGKIATNSVPKISVGYNDFQQIWMGAVAVAQFNKLAVAPPTVVNASSNLIYQINVAKITP